MGLCEAVWYPCRLSNDIFTGLSRGVLGFRGCGLEIGEAQLVEGRVGIWPLGE